VDTRKVNSSERIIAVYEDVITFWLDCIGVRMRE
jgi:hypothetical protein